MHHVAKASSVQASAPISQAVRQAAAKTRAGFGYLMQTAMRESSLNPAAKAPGSSATGLFQFVEQTWLGVMKGHGAEHGLGSYAAAIETDSRGRQYVPDAQMRQEILALRKDPQVSALMAGALTEENRQTLECRLGRSVNDGELYAAHFLGADAAATLIGKAEADPTASASTLFPSAARANRSIFYASDGRARSVAEVCAKLTGGAGGADGPAPTMLAEVARAPQNEAESGRARFAALDGGSGGQIGGGMPARQALILSPRVIALLSSLDPIPGGYKASRISDEPKALNTVA